MAGTLDRKPPPWPNMDSFYNCWLAKPQHHQPTAVNIPCIEGSHIGHNLDNHAQDTAYSVDM